MKSFKMLCFSSKCSGTAKGVVKFENVRITDCPDCHSALYQTFHSGRRKIRENKTVYRPDANYGLKSRKNNDGGLDV